ncbi:MAG: hypothetical protein NVS3B10_07590 [Polyangiales bacterium]
MSNSRSSSRFVRFGFAAALAAAAFGVSIAAWADNPIQIENAKPVDPVKDNWQPDYDASYAAKNIGIDGIIDGYPSSWSVKNGDTLGLKVSTTAASFRTRIYRLGWYNKVGSRLVWENASTPGEKQPFPAENTDTGLVEANWHPSLSVTIPGDWVTGQYVVRFTTDTGMEAYTYFALRDDAAPTKGAILFVDSLATAFAYNPWPKTVDATGKVTGGKSLYSYNSGGTPTQASGDVQAVAVSFDRPHGENWGLGIWRDWTVPMVQWLEMKGYDVAYANSIDQHEGYVFGSRKVWLDAGHDEYVTRAMWDNLEAARDAGLNLAFLSANDFSWQVRFEAGSGGPQSTMVSYKIAAYPDEGRCGTCWTWGGDPEFAASQKAKAAGDTAGVIAHLRNVSYAWAGLKDWDPNAPSPTFPGSRGAPLAASTPIARVQIGLEGLMNGPKLPSCKAGAPLTDACYGVNWIVDNSSHWIYAGTGLKDGDILPLIVGYEMDNLRDTSTYASRPPTQVKLAHTDATFAAHKDSAPGAAGVFNAQYYQAKSGAHVFATGTINWGWGLERPDVGQWGGIALDTKVSNGSRLDAVVSQITTNVLDKMITGPGTPPTTYPDAGPGTPDGGPASDGGGPGPDGSLPDGGTPDGSPGGVDGGGPGSPDGGGPGSAPEGGTGSSGGCTYGGTSTDGSLLLLAGLATVGAIASRRRRRA